MGVPEEPADFPTDSAQNLDYGIRDEDRDPRSLEDKLRHISPSEDGGMVEGQEPKDLAALPMGVQESMLRRIITVKVAWASTDDKRPLGLTLDWDDGRTLSITKIETGL